MISFSSQGLVLVRAASRGDFISLIFNAGFQCGMLGRNVGKKLGNIPCLMSSLGGGS
jgi:hypothetical protein